MLEKPELLAPAGNFEALKAAVENGTDAVYLGGKNFNARQFAENFTLEELERAIDYAHLRGVKVYVTVNTLIKNQEFKEAMNFLKEIYEMGADAVILQDLGIFSLIKKINLPIECHASTQMTIHSAEGAKLLEQLGFKRVIIARELSLEEIKQIKKQVNIELECFVHGALCFSYSGQCLMSSLIGGRSANRGRCAQPCRKRYALLNGKGEVLACKYLLSTRDLKTLEHIKDLINAGIAGFKIEGRMRRAEYVAIVTRAYRNAIDYLSTSEEEEKKVRQIFNRGFTPGYFYGKLGREMMSYDSPDNRGIEIGRVLCYDGKMAEILLEDSLRRGDGIEINGAGAMVTRLEVGGRKVEVAKPGEIVRVKIAREVEKGSRVYKTLDAELIEEARGTYKGFNRKVPVDVKASLRIGKPFTLLLEDEAGNIVVETSECIAQSALKHSLTKDALIRQLNRLSETPFSLRKVSIDLDEGAFIAYSAIANTRRRAVKALEEKRIMRVKRKFEFELEDATTATRAKEKPILAVNAYSLGVLRGAIEGGADLIYLPHSLCREAIEICRKSGVKLVAHTGRITKDSELNLLKLEEVDGALVGNLGSLKLLCKRTSLPLYLDFSLNVFNSYAANFLNTEFSRIETITLSPELNLREIKAIVRSSNSRFECIVHGFLPLMISEHCIAGSILSDSMERCSAPCKRDRYSIQDEAGYVFPLYFDSSCRMHILNSRELCMLEYLPELIEAGISSLRIETLNITSDRVKQIVSIYRRNLDSYIENPTSYEFDPKDKMAFGKEAGLTYGHYFRGVE